MRVLDDVTNRIKTKAKGERRKAG